jgi:hypothetical protein
MLDAILIGVASGAVISLALDVIGHAEGLTDFFRKFHFRNHFHLLRRTVLTPPPEEAAHPAPATQHPKRNLC